MNPIRFTALACAAFLCAAALLGISPIHGEDGICDHVIRLHILAVSDDAAEQARKLRVRDAVLESLADLPRGLTKEEAKAALLMRFPQIEAAARTVIGEDFPLRLTLTRETYPARQYGDFLLPSGEYDSLRVILGEGKGHNWWCVVYPQLCTARAEEEDFIAAGFTPEQYRVIRPDSGTVYRIRFRILDWIMQLLGRAQ